MHLYKSNNPTLLLGLRARRCHQRWHNRITKVQKSHIVLQVLIKKISENGEGSDTTRDLYLKSMLFRSVSYVAFPNTAKVQKMIGQSQEKKLPNFFGDLI